VKALTEKKISVTSLTASSVVATEGDDNAGVGDPLPTDPAQLNLTIA